MQDHAVKKYESFRFRGKNPGTLVGLAGRILSREAIRKRFPSLEFVDVPSVEAFVNGEVEEVEALLLPAEVASYYTMIRPEFALVIPDEATIRVPFTIAIHPDSPRAERYLDTWLGLRRRDGSLDELYDHWILGKQSEGKKRRWSIIHDVLGWVD